LLFIARCAISCLDTSAFIHMHHFAVQDDVCMQCGG
jgi:hypothetical protein